ncbi:MAG: disulfide bond formation protein [Actinomycetia bacterium]|nr:disulfide bond formation protein [Actinomycetes bacterium]
MDTQAVTLFLALLAVVAQIAAVAVVVLLATGRRRLVAEAIGPQALAVAACVAVVATLGSLYFSEVAHFTPCKLCWYQRIAMYPLAPILVIAAARRDVGIRLYAAVLAGLGAVIASYHVILERYPTLESSVCDPTNPCTLIWVRRFGYLTIPGMALSGFALILVLLAVARPEEP